MIRIIEVKVSTQRNLLKRSTKTVDAKKLSVTVKKLQPNKKYFAKSKERMLSLMEQKYMANIQRL